MQERPDKGAEPLALTITARRFEGILIVASVTPAPGGGAADGSTAGEPPPAFAVFSSNSHAELDAGCVVLAHPPVHMVVSPGGLRVALCANIAQA